MKTHISKAIDRGGILTITGISLFIIDNGSCTSIKQECVNFQIILIVLLYGSVVNGEFCSISGTVFQVV